MNKPHVHAEVIKAWADGAEIEYLSKLNGKWQPVDVPLWSKKYEYRVKPKVTHKIGNIYEFCNGSRQMLACSANFHVVMIEITGPLRGYRAEDACEVKDILNITEEEFRKIVGGNPSDFTLIETND